MKNIFILLSIGVLFTLSCNDKNIDKDIDNKDTHTDNDIDMNGIWQDSREIAAGWGDAYQFFPDGTFIFNYNQMIFDRRTYSLMGDWNKNSSSDIILTIKQKQILEGGEITSDDLGNNFIEGGELKTITLDKPESMKLILTEYGIDAGEDYGYETIKLNNIQYWKITDDPNEY